jgi:acyl phosphate:glycerol-3-phosphate acyltransferase
MIELIVKVALAYLVGSLVGSLLIGRLRGVDIRTLGSGNAGATNMLRTQGKIAALAVLLIDLAPRSRALSRWTVRCSSPPAGSR